MTKEKFTEEISSCPHCFCSTHTTSEGKCGKCKEHKAKVGTDNSDIPSNENKTISDVVEIIKLWRPVFYGKTTKQELDWLAKTLTHIDKSAREDCKKAEKMLVCSVCQNDIETPKNVHNAKK